MTYADRHDKRTHAETLIVRFGDLNPRQLGAERGRGDQDTHTR